MGSPRPLTSTGRGAEITASSDVQALRGWDNLTRLSTHRHRYRYRWCEKCACTDGVDHLILNDSAFTKIRPATRLQGPMEALKHIACTLQWTIGYV